MGRIFLIENENNQDSLTAEIKDRFPKAIILAFSTADDAIKRLKQEILRPIVIARAKLQAEEGTANKLYDYLCSVGEQNSLILLGEDPVLKFIIPCIKYPLELENLMIEIGRRIFPEFSSRDREFVPVKISFLETFKETPCDIYIRIRQGEDYLYIRLLNRFEIIENEKIENYKSKALHFVYVSTEAVGSFYEAMSNHFLASLDDPQLEVETKIPYAAETYSLIKEMINDLEGLEHTKTMSESSIKFLKSTLSSPKAMSLIGFLVKNDINFDYKHCHLRLLLCHFILAKQSWYNEQYMAAFTFASFFADITLETPEEMLISQFKELEESKMYEERRLKVLFHPKEAADIASNFPGFTETAKTIILQSNGTPDGYSFEDQPKENLHALSKVFIIADEFVRLLLNPRHSSLKRDILKTMNERYTLPTYQKIIKTLEQRIGD